jgi:hypothetical protein
MDAKELRVGNYLLQTNQIDYDTLGHKRYPDSVITVGKHLFTYEDDDIKPIPLTEEWLLKFGVLFGFSHCGSQYDIEFGLDCYNLRLPYDIGMSKFIGEIKHVHQLQNLYFALTGKELKSAQIKKI